METIKYQLISEFDGLKLDVLSIKADQAKATLVISHGMAEHKERYLELMQFLASNGYNSVIHDHRGHGESVKNSQDYGYFYDDDAQAIVNDLRQVISDSKKRYPNTPLFLLGHSMGSMVVRNLIKIADDEIDALVVCGSPSNSPLSGLALTLVKTLEKIKGPRHRSNLIQQLAFGSYTKGIEGDVAERWLSYNQDNVSAYCQNPKDGFIFTLNGFKNLFTLMQNCYNPSGWKLANLKLPILFIAGHDDPVIMSESKFEEAYNFLKKLGYFDIEAILYPKMRHEIFNEENNQLVFNDLLNWFNKQINKNDI